MTWQDPYQQPGWQDPYGQYGPDGYPQPGQDPSAQYGQYGQYGQGAADQAGWQDPYAQYAYGYAGPPVPQAPSNGVTIGALVANVVVTFLTCGIGLTWLPGIILSAVALGRINTDPVFARKLTLWAWVCFAADIVITVAIFVLFAVFAGDPAPTASTP
jgi:hypothetical protein